MNARTEPIPEPRDLYPELPVSDPYYGPAAYNSRKIPNQPPQTEDHNRGWVSRKTNMRLPWGNAWEVAPLNVLRLSQPNILRKVERDGCQIEDTGVVESRLDHECIKRAPYAWYTRTIAFLGATGKLLSIIVPPLVLLTYIVAIFNYPLHSSPGQQALDTLPVMLGFIAVPLSVWGAIHALQRYCPKIVFKSGKGPDWELNRRTGMVTYFDYSAGKRNPKPVSAPFYEFDAYVGSTPDRQGLPMHFFYLYHRYSKLEVDLNAMFGGAHRGEIAFAFWDLIQNYMDISRPLPDLPMWEEYRHLDPVTAEYDRRTGRNPRYWLDMDDDTWKAKQAEMESKVRRIDTTSRSNLMAEHVDYQV